MIRVSLFLSILLSLLLLADIAVAKPGQVQRFPAPQGTATRLVIRGTTDLDVFAATIRDYQQLHPHAEVVYEDRIAQQVPVDLSGDDAPDLLISSSMDLQTRLANDGQAQVHRTALSEALPPWAHWRHEVIAISYEPVVMVYNPRLLPAARVPRSHRQLLDLLRAADAPLAGRIGSYDIEHSSVGYLLASQDHQTGSLAGAILSALGGNQVRLEESTGALLDRVARGELKLAYNVLGSYAQLRVDAGAPLGIIEPEDYTLVLLRTALVPKTARHPDQAHCFLDYLLSPRGQNTLVRRAGLKPFLPAGNAPYAGAAQVPPFRPIHLGPGLLVDLDELKRRQFLEAWRSTVNPPVSRRIP
jgi:iron(III) transport system substrate-binding protein